MSNNNLPHGLTDLTFFSPEFICCTCISVKLNRNVFERNRISGCTQPHSNHFPPLAVAMKADAAACCIKIEVTLRILLLSRFAAVFVASHTTAVTELNVQGWGDASA
jgi:hypothetical protein